MPDQQLTDVSYNRPMRLLGSAAVLLVAFGCGRDGDEIADHEAASQETSASATVIPTTNYHAPDSKPTQAQSASPQREVEQQGKSSTFVTILGKWVPSDTAATKIQLLEFSDGGKVSARVLEDQAWVTFEGTYKLDGKRGSVYLDSGQVYDTNSPASDGEAMASKSARMDMDFVMSTDGTLLSIGGNQYLRSVQ